MTEEGAEEKFTLYRKKYNRILYVFNLAWSFEHSELETFECINRV
jgi:hypothetical protein